MIICRASGKFLSTRLLFGIVIASGLGSTPVLAEPQGVVEWFLADDGTYSATDPDDLLIGPDGCPCPDPQDFDDDGEDFLTIFKDGFTPVEPKRFQRFISPPFEADQCITGPVVVKLFLGSKGKTVRSAVINVDLFERVADDFLSLAQGRPTEILLGQAQGFFDPLAADPLTGQDVDFQEKVFAIVVPSLAEKSPTVAAGSELVLRVTTGFRWTDNDVLLAYDDLDRRSRMVYFADSCSLEESLHITDCSTRTTAIRFDIVDACVGTGCPGGSDPPSGTINLATVPGFMDLLPDIPQETEIYVECILSVTNLAREISIPGTGGLVSFSPVDSGEVVFLGDNAPQGRRKFTIRGVINLATWEDRSYSWVPIGAVSRTTGDIPFSWEVDAEGLVCPLLCRARAILRIRGLCSGT